MPAHASLGQLLDQLSAVAAQRLTLVRLGTLNSLLNGCRQLTGQRLYRLEQRELLDNINLGEKHGSNS